MDRPRKNTVLHIDLDAIRHNLAIMASRCAPETARMAVVKANAYGHGAVPVARAVAPLVDAFAVNDIREGIELRRQGIDQQILVFGTPVRDEAPLYREHDITATVSAGHHFDILTPGTAYHLNVDTGMGRFGFRVEALKDIRQLMNEHQSLHCTGAYSHFATADAPSSPLIKQQYERFLNVKEGLDSTLCFHMCNTGGTFSYPEAQLDMIRTGIGMYGYAPGTVAMERLRPALRWETQIVDLRRVSRGDTVSYGARWQAPSAGWIGVIPAGYYDGIPRGLSNNFSVRMDGASVPVVGTVTMNYCMLWLGERKAAVGQTVELLHEAQHAGHWARKMDTIPYEILSRLPAHIERSYCNMAINSMS